MRIIIRADGNREIALGHIMRCLSIADVMKTKAEVVFVTAGRETEELIRSRGFRNAVLGTDYRDMESELPALEAFLAEYPAQLILADSYFVTGNYMEALGKLAKTAYIDDLGRPVYPVTTLVNYNIYAPALPYETWYREAGLPLPAEILTGCQYAPLREEFRKRRRSGQEPYGKEETVKDVLITTGGGDMANAAVSLCRRLLAEMQTGAHEGIRYHVICGPFAESREVLREIAAARPQFILHENVTNMSELMAKCDIAVSAAGSTMYELCSMRLPAVCFYFAENQRRMAECFDRTTEIKNAGNITEDREGVLKCLLERLSGLERDAALRERIRGQMAELTDGCGAVRLAEKLLACAGCGGKVRSG